MERGRLTKILTAAGGAIALNAALGTTPSVEIDNIQQGTYVYYANIECWSQIQHLNLPTEEYSADLGCRKDGYVYDITSGHRSTEGLFTTVVLGNDEKHWSSR